MKTPERPTSPANIRTTGRYKRPPRTPRRVQLLIQRCARYAFSPNGATERFMRVKHCELCACQLEHNGLALPDAIDHLHKSPGGSGPYRGRLCMWCNTAEGIRLKQARCLYPDDEVKRATSHVDLLCEHRPVPRDVVIEYLARTDNTYTLVE